MLAINTSIFWKIAWGQFYHVDLLVQYGHRWKMSELLLTGSSLYAGKWRMSTMGHNGQDTAQHRFSLAGAERLAVLCSSSSSVFGKPVESTSMQPRAELYAARWASLDRPQRGMKYGLRHKWQGSNEKWESVNISSSEENYQQLYVLTIFVYMKVLIKLGWTVNEKGLMDELELCLTGLQLLKKK